MKFYAFLSFCYSVFLPVSADLKINWDEVKPNPCKEDTFYELDSKVDLSILIHIMAIHDISEEKMEFGMQLYLTEMWENRQLNVSKYIDLANGKIMTRVIPASVAKCLWQPDTIFLNAKETVLYDATLPNSVMRLGIPFNLLVRSKRYKIIASCNMDFHLYPMDIQECALDIGLLASSKREVELNWCELTDPFTFVGEHNLPNFEILIKNVTTSELLNYKDNTIRQNLHANISLVRSLTASVMNTYVPSFLVVCLSMVSFWLDVNAVPGRVTLGVTALLTLSTEIVHVRSALPTLDYMTAMDVWLLGCVIMVFLSLIEFTLAQSWARKVENRKTATKENKAEIVKHHMPAAWSILKWKKCARLRQKLRQHLMRIKSSQKVKINSFHEAEKDNFLDRLSRVIFPLVATCFICVYWVYFYELAYGT